MRLPQATLPLALGGLGFLVFYGIARQIFEMRHFREYPFAFVLLVHLVLIAILLAQPFTVYFTNRRRTPAPGNS